MLLATGITAATFASSCSTTPEAPPPCTPGGDGSYLNESLPTLSGYCMVSVQNARIVPLSSEIVPYAPSSTLFSDYALKARTVWVPKGKSIAYDETKVFDLPVGSIITKSFGYPKDLRSPEPVQWIETRLLLRTETGFRAISYVWDDDQKEARIRPGGQTRDVPFIKEDGTAVTATYLVPNQNQCKKCHGDGESNVIIPIGLRGDRLAGDYAYATGAENQLAHWSKLGILTGVPSSPKVMPSWSDESLPVDVRARAYLDSNCSHCHSDVGEARTTGLHLGFDVTDPYRLGTCKTPVAAGAGAGTFTYDVVPGKPAESIMIFRMKATQPAVAMPEIGRSLVHDEGVDLVTQWIAGMPGNCK
ncbi:hypothetical protein BH09MYX1_BH09MYX1_52990 [soil metagenome]